MTKLRKPLYATGIHGITGQDIDTGFLPADTLIKDARQTGTNGQNVRFTASTNGGKNWYYQRADGAEFRAAAPDSQIEVLEI
jgi:hypothetical protein